MMGMSNDFDNGPLTRPRGTFVPSVGGVTGHHGTPARFHVAPGSLTTTNANDILVFATDTAGNETGWTADTMGGYTIPNNNLAVGASGLNIRQAMQYKVVSSALTNTTTSMTYTPSNWNGNIFAAFK